MKRIKERCFGQVAAEQTKTCELKNTDSEAYGLLLTGCRSCAGAFSEKKSLIKR
ncbi:MAG: hypothetical protein K6A32_03820 [Bacteroidales bacterium]|nr:hypothetical protein [Bacteroidales bacterium]